MSNFSNGLTNAEAERIAILAEECGEVLTEFFQSRRRR